MLNKSLNIRITPSHDLYDAVLELKHVVNRNDETSIQTATYSSIELNQLQCLALNFAFALVNVGEDAW